MSAVSNPREHQLSAVVELVTPQIATEYLATRGPNRIVALGRVRHYAFLMSSGLFQLTHQGIAFLATGELVDGQHRLEAIIMSGVPCLLLVVRGLDPETRLYIDEGRPRTVADSIRIDGRAPDASQYDVEIARRLVSGRSGFVSGGGSNRVPRELILKSLSFFDDSIRFSNRMLGGKQRGVGRLVVREVVARAHYSNPSKVARLERFCTILTDDGSMPISTDETAATKIRSMLQEMFVTTHSKLGAGLYGKIEYALRSFLDGKPLSKISSSKEELFETPSLSLDS